jgi:hypothetical protein
MSTYFRSSVRRVLIGVVTIFLAATGAIVGVGGFQSAPAQTSRGLDHFLCYDATAVSPAAAAGFTPPQTVVLSNQFSRMIAAPSVVTTHCNPVQKTANGVVTRISNPYGHLVCWKIGISTQPSFRVKVTNQFGTAILVTYPPDLLCLPTWKSLTGPPTEKMVQPPGLSHFTCYAVGYDDKSRFHPPAFVSLTDQFGSHRAEVGRPLQLCVPTMKIAHGKVSPITNAGAHLMCFAVSFQSKPLKVFDKNQFGSSPVVVQKVKSLCLPSSKKIIPPPTTTTTTKNTTTTIQTNTTTTNPNGTTTTSIPVGQTTTTNPNQTTTTCQPGTGRCP